MNDATDASSVSDFDIDRSTAEAWALFGTRLAEVLSVMDESAELTIGAVASEQVTEPPFVQFRCLPAGRLRAETPGNAELGAHFQLTADQLAALERGGWTPPSPDGPSATRFETEGEQEAPQVLADKAIFALHEVFGVPHPAFLAPDHLAEILTPPAVAELPAQPPPSFTEEELVAVQPRDRQHLDALVRAQLGRLLGHPPVQDADGDYGIRVGSTMVFVRTTPDAREVLVFASLVHDVDGRSRAMEVLSDLNTDARFVRFILIRDRVYASLSVYGQPFVPAHLSQALQLVTVTSDAIDNELAAKLRGRTTFADEGPGADDHT
ncbi:T3SS (YopN, CesT) and YbjN peptide-binding chaperone 1 [Propioniciclava tarda]|uniref:YbjN domain-containing protein n=1 Tax=Propioniciclava tarda TaxID=433330 RepID=A0A4Q9KN64_PROTD|nr:hypothetical protein [Propioniciclava tarda]TBT96027.1 hypothetical protein ET996_03440 [Propioniciclava tarda]SMO43221.1 hypothetical protein SAMN06266982_102314 [Propioniciclava tarda]